MQDKIYFRTRGGSRHGWGNVIRLASFASFCRNRGHRDLTFFVEGPPEVIKYLEEEGFKVVSLAEDLTIDAENKLLAQYPEASFFFVEMLDSTYAHQQMLKHHARSLIVFDDILDHIYCADLVVCGQALPDYGNKELSHPETKFLIGFEYFLCRPQFMPYIGKKRCLEEHVKKVLISFGGGRYDIAYLKTAHALKKYEKEIKPVFILGYAAQEELKEQIQNLIPNATICGGVSNIEELFWDSDLSIINGGYHKLEAASTSTPAIMISVQFHQIPLAEEFSRITGFPNLGYMSFVCIDKIQKAFDDLTHIEKRIELSNRAKQVIDGKGFHRVYSHILS